MIEGCKNKQPLAQKQLYQFCYATIHKVATRYVADADKLSIVLNNAMLKVFTNLSNYNHQGFFLAWVKQIAVNTSVDYVRIKSNMRITHEVTEHSNNDFQIEASIVEKIDREAVVAIINSLPEKHALVFNLYVYEEYDHNEIGELLSMPASTSRYYLSEARRLLKQKMENNIDSLRKAANNE